MKDGGGPAAAIVLAMLVAAFVYALLPLLLPIGGR